MANYRGTLRFYYSKVDVKLLSDFCSFFFNQRNQVCFRKKHAKKWVDSSLGGHLVSIIYVGTYLTMGCFTTVDSD